MAERKASEKWPFGLSRGDVEALEAEVERLTDCEALAVEVAQDAVADYDKARAGAEALAEALQELIISIDGYVWKSLPKDVCDRATDAIARYRRGEHG